MPTSHEEKTPTLSMEVVAAPSGGQYTEMEAAMNGVLCNLIENLAQTSPEKLQKIDKVTCLVRFQTRVVPEEARIELTLK